MDTCTRKICLNMTVQCYILKSPNYLNFNTKDNIFNASISNEDIFDLSFNTIFCILKSIFPPNRKKKKEQQQVIMRFIR